MVQAAMPGAQPPMPVVEPNVDLRLHQQFTGQIYVRVRLGTLSDVPVICKLIHEMAALEMHGHPCEATDASLYSALLQSCPFQSVTVFLLEVSRNPIPDSHAPTEHLFRPINKSFNLSYPIDDPDAFDFLPEGPYGPVVAGFVLFFPNYSSLRANHGFYLEDLYVRDVYSKKGIGRLVIKAVANQAVKLGYGRVEWRLLRSVNAERFYHQIGAEVLPDLRICRLTGDALKSFGDCS